MKNFARMCVCLYVVLKIVHCSVIFVWSVTLPFLISLEQQQYRSCMVARTVKARAFKELEGSKLYLWYWDAATKKPWVWCHPLSAMQQEERKKVCVCLVHVMCWVLSCFCFSPNPVSAGPVLSLPRFGVGPKSFQLLNTSTQLSCFLSCHICHNPPHHPSNSSSLHTQAPSQLTVQCCVSVKVY